MIEQVPPEDSEVLPDQDQRIQKLENIITELEERISVLEGFLTTDN